MYLVVHNVYGALHLRRRHRPSLTPLSIRLLSDATTPTTTLERVLLGRHRRRVAHAPEGVVPAAVFEPAGRNDLLRRVRKDFDGEPFDGSVIDFVDGRPTAVSKAKGKGGEGGKSGTL